MGNCSSTHQSIIIHSPTQIYLNNNNKENNNNNITPHNNNNNNNNINNINDNNNLSNNNNQNNNQNNNNNYYYYNNEEYENNSKDTFNSVPNRSLTPDIQSSHSEIIIYDNYITTENEIYELEIPDHYINNNYSKNQDSDSISGVISTISSLTSHSGSTKRSLENPEQLRSSPPFMKNPGPKTPESIRASRSLFTPYKSQFSSSTLAYNTIDEHTFHS